MSEPSKVEAERDSAQHHLAYHLKDFRPGADMEATGDLAVDMAHYAERMRDERDGARAHGADMEARVRAVVAKWSGPPLETRSMSLVLRDLRALLDAAPAGGAELKDAVTLDEAKKPCTCGHIRAAHFTRDGCLAKVTPDARSRFCACDEFGPALDTPSEVPHD